MVHHENAVRVDLSSREEFTREEITALVFCTPGQERTKEQISRMLGLANSELVELRQSEGFFDGLVADRRTAWNFLVIQHGYSASVTNQWCDQWSDQEGERKRDLEAAVFAGMRIYGEPVVISDEIVRLTMQNKAEVATACERLRQIDVIPDLAVPELVNQLLKRDDLELVPTLSATIFSLGTEALSSLRKLAESNASHSRIGRLTDLIKKLSSLID